MFITAMSVYARIAFAVIIAAILGMSHWKVYVMGKNTVQNEWNKAQVTQTKQLAAKEQEYRQQEQNLVAAKNQAEEKYVEIKKHTAVAVAGARSELDRLRRDLAARSLPRAGADSATGTGAHGEAVVGEVFGDCAARYAGLAEEADAVRDKLIGLQGYVNNVCQNGTAQPGVDANNK